MTVTTRYHLLRVLDRALIGALIFIAMILIGVQITNAGEIIPSVGISRPVHADDNEATIAGGLAIRGDMGRFFMPELAVSYRSESREGGDLEIRQWPITASLWFKPVEMLYVGGGAGWYHTSFDYNDALGIESETTQDFGVHLGGGFRVPISSKAALDLNGRYVMLEDIENKISTENIDPDFWTTTVGLGIRF